MSRIPPAPSPPAGSEELDQPIVITRLRWWIPLVSAAALCLGALAWGIWGRVPITVNGLGVLIDPGAIHHVVAPTAGVVDAVLVEPGQRIEAGAIIARLERTAVEQSLKQSRETLAAVIAANTPMREINRRHFDAEKELFDHEQALLRESRLLAERLDKAASDQLASMRELFEKGYVGRENVLAAETAVADSHTRIVNIDVRLQELEAHREQAAHHNAQAEFTLRTQIDEARRAVEKLQLQVDLEGTIRASSAGRVLETMVTPGRTVSFGSAVATLATSERHDALRVLSYFAIKDGKQITPGMRIIVTPSTVKRERHGGIVGKVTHVSFFPVSREAAIHRLASEELAHAFTNEGAVIEVDAELEPARRPGSGSDYAWTSQAPAIAITQGTVTHNRVTVEERAPITYVLPLLRSWFMGARDQARRRSDREHARASAIP